MPLMNGRKLLYHFDGIRGKMSEMRELVETLDLMFDSFHKMNRISKNMFGLHRTGQDRLRR
ncbi:MAG: hypothetical protein H0Z34_05910 [Brevibacillus sp.]|nr:hypothetical protein [Brevibacillus sp.]